jgi:Myotubularin-like phosphatase domain
VIYDARSYLNALANRVTSGGYENTTDYYRGCELMFCDIDNIHAVRNSVTQVYDLSNSLLSNSA